ncbi:MAG: hypothetical protein IKG46_09135 [Solobacterium sp.]|nr:hypothetical protein [Solobacterium sp.]
MAKAPWNEKQEISVLPVSCENTKSVLRYYPSGYHLPLFVQESRRAEKTSAL